MVQIDLFSGKSEAQQKFDKFHKENPKVYEELLALAKQAHDRGRSKIGINMLVEVVRWNRYIQTRGDVFKINNNFAPYYVRLIIENHPELEHLFELRRIRT